MKLFNFISEWMEANHEKKVAKMEAQGLCPDCQGNGYNAFMFSEYAYIHPDDFHCHGCKGSGSFSDWAENQNEQ